MIQYIMKRIFFYFFKGNALIDIAHLLERYPRERTELIVELVE
jgi:hypothetical protein